MTTRNYSFAAQVSRLDSLETFLAESNPDSKRILILDDLVDELINVDLDRAISYAHEALDLSRIFRYSKTKSQSSKGLLFYWRA